MSKKQSIGSYFGVDRAAIAKACELGMNPAVAYLVLACFSDKTNRYTPASVQAIETHTGIPRRYAKETIEKLVTGKLIRRVPRDGERPRYELLSAPPAPPPPSVKAREYRKEQLSPVQREAFEMVERGEKLRGKWSAAAKIAKRKGWLDQLNYSGPFTIRPPEPPPQETKPKMVWLPNELVLGVGDEQSPVDRIRQTGDPRVLHLFVDFYSELALSDDGGIDRRTLYQPFKSERVGSYAQHNLWSYTREEHKYMGGPLLALHQRGKEDPIWNRINTITRLGLLQWRLQLFDAPDGELLHPLGFLDSGERAPETDVVWLESKIGYAAISAGMRMHERLGVQPSVGAVVPVRAHIAAPTMIGIARLRYRPKVTDTARWVAELMRNKDGWIQEYNEILPEPLYRNERAANA